MVGEVVVELVSNVMVHLVVVLLVVLLMRLPKHPRLSYHPSIPHLGYFDTTPKTFKSLKYSLPPLETFSPYVIPPSSPTCPTLEATWLPFTTSQSLALPPIDKTMIDLVLDLGTCPPRRPWAPCAHRVILPSAPFEIAHALTDHIVVYSRRSKIKTKPPSCGTH